MAIADGDAGEVGTRGSGMTVGGEGQEQHLEILKSSDGAR